MKRLGCFNVDLDTVIHKKLEDLAALHPLDAEAVHHSGCAADTFSHFLGHRQPVLGILLSRFPLPPQRDQVRHGPLH